MGNNLELFDGRVSQLHITDTLATVHLSYALIHHTIGSPGRDTGKSWSQEAILMLEQPEINGPLPSLPNTIAEGYLEIGTVRHEPIPLPFKHEGAARLHLIFRDDSKLDITGVNPVIELQGIKVHLDGYT